MAAEVPGSTAQNSGNGRLGYKSMQSNGDIRATMTYTHVLNRGGLGIRSSADGLALRSDER